MLTIITKIYKSIYIFFNFFFFFFWFRNNSSQNVSFNLYSRLIFEYYLHFLDGERYFHVYLQWKMGKNSEIRRKKFRKFGQKISEFRKKFGKIFKIRTFRKNSDDSDPCLNGSFNNLSKTSSNFVVEACEGSFLTSSANS